MISVEPYEAVGPLGFGTAKDDVVAILGQPKATTRDRRGNDVLRYDQCIATIGSEGLIEVGFLPDAPLCIRGVFPFSDPNAFSKLCMLDGDPREVLGFIVLLNLGMTMTGFHDKDEAQKAVTVFSRGRWDVLKAEMKPYRLSEE